MTIDIERFIERHDFGEAVQVAHNALRRPNPAGPGLFRPATLPGDHEPFIAALDLRTMATTALPLVTLIQDEQLLDDPVYRALSAVTDGGRDIWTLIYLAGPTSTDPSVRLEWVADVAFDMFTARPQHLTLWLGAKADERLAAADVIRDTPARSIGYGPEGHEYRIGSTEALAHVFMDECEDAHAAFAVALGGSEAA